MRFGLATALLGDGFFGIGCHFFFGQEGEDAFSRRGSLLQHVGNIGNLHQGVLEGAYVLHEGLDIAN